MEFWINFGEILKRSGLSPEATRFILSNIVTNDTTSELSEVLIQVIQHYSTLKVDGKFVYHRYTSPPYLTMVPQHVGYLRPEGLNQLTSNLSKPMSKFFMYKNTPDSVYYTTFTMTGKDIYILPTIVLEDNIDVTLDKNLQPEHRLILEKYREHWKNITYLSDLGLTFNQGQLSLTQEVWLSSKTETKLTVVNKQIFKMCTECSKEVGVGISEEVRNNILMNTLDTLVTPSFESEDLNNFKLSLVSRPQ